MLFSSLRHLQLRISMKLLQRLWKGAPDLSSHQEREEPWTNIGISAHLAGGVPFRSGKQGEVFDDERKLLFIIKPQQDFMIIFITSLFTTLGALKVNNLCLLKLPFKESRELCRL